MKQAERRLERLLKAKDRALNNLNIRFNRKIELAKLALGDSCSHPVECVLDSTWEHDNGYGRQTKLPCKYCRLCRKTNYFPSISNSWVARDEISFD